SGAIDDFRVAGRDRRRDLDNLLPVDQDVGLLQVAYPRVEAQDDTATQQNSALSPVTDEALEICRRRRAQAFELSRTPSVRWSSAATNRRGNGGGTPHGAGA